jgi:hypothetical protein
MLARLASFAFLALLTFVPTGLRAQSATLTAAEQQTLLKLMDAHGHELTLSQDVTVLLGISKGNEVVIRRQLAVNEHPQIHAYIPLADGSVMLGFSDGVTAYSYRLDANQKLAAAVSKKGDQVAAAIPVADAGPNADVELKYWAALADAHPDGK